MIMVRAAVPSGQIGRNGHAHARRQGARATLGAKTHAPTLGAKTHARSARARKTPGRVSG
jgi:hypothetical protein